MGLAYSTKMQLGLQTSTHIEQLMHLAMSIWYEWATLGSPVIASVGQAFSHNEQPVQSDWITLWVIRALHLPAGQRWSTMWAIYSSLKYRKVVNTGLGAVPPKAQRLLSTILTQSSSKRSRSSSFALPSLIKVKSSFIRKVPIRQKVHFPQDSSWVNWRKNLAKSTMQVLSSKTI